MSAELKKPRPARWLSPFAVSIGLLALSTQDSALSTAQEPPLVGQPTANFYNAQGTKVKVAWLVEPTTVMEDDELTATLTITGATNPQRIVRPDLKKLDTFRAHFVVTDSTTDPKPAADATEVKFSYKLRPRNLDVASVPRLEFYYHNPTAGAGKQFPLTTATKVEITVTPRPAKKPPPPVPLREPEHLFRVHSGPEILDGKPFTPGVATWVALTLLGPLTALGWYVSWRRVYPNAVRLARIRRSRASRRATDAIRRAARATDPPAAFSEAVLGYLRERFTLPPGAVTPTEIAAALAELRVPAAACQTVARFFQQCDAARFAPESDNRVSLAFDAAALVARLEAA